MTKKLSDRVEADHTGSMGLANEVLLACGWEVEPYPEMPEYHLWTDPLGDLWDDLPDGISYPPNPLLSLDAAILTIPKGWRWFRTKDDWMYVEEETWEIGSSGPRAFGSAGANPARALTAAALKARDL